MLWSPRCSWVTALSACQFFNERLQPFARGAPLRRLRGVGSLDSLQLRDPYE